MQHYSDKNAINWTWVYIFGKVGAVSFTTLSLRHYRCNNNNNNKENKTDAK